MRDHTVSVHPPPFDYDHPGYRAAAAAEAKDQTRGHCRLCGSKRDYSALHAHHWTRCYPPPGETTANLLTPFCGDLCHDVAHLVCFYRAAGGEPEALCAALAETVATLLWRRPGAERLPASSVRVGQPRRIGSAAAEDRWGAFVIGRSRPRVGEVFRLLPRTCPECWDAVVTEVIGPRAGGWLVRKESLSKVRRRPDAEVRLMCVKRHAAQNRRMKLSASHPFDADPGLGVKRRSPA